MNDRFLEERINIRFCLKLGNGACDICGILSEVYEGDAMKKSIFLSGTNGSKAARTLKSQIKKMFVTFFEMKGTVHFKFTPQGQTLNQVYFVEILKWLCEAVSRKEA